MDENTGVGEESGSESKKGKDWETEKFIEIIKDGEC